MSTMILRSAHVGSIVVFEAATKPEAIARLLATHGLGPRPHRRGQRHEGSCGTRYLARER